jgi:hypothetical protein
MAVKPLSEESFGRSRNASPGASQHPHAVPLRPGGVAGGVGDPRPLLVEGERPGAQQRPAARARTPPPRLGWGP